MSARKPGPWRVEPCGEDHNRSFNVHSPDGFFTNVRKEVKPHADLLVEACNAYDGLVEDCAAFAGHNEVLRKALGSALRLLVRSGTYLSHPDVAKIPFAVNAGHCAETIARFVTDHDALADTSLAGKGGAE